MNDAYYKRFHKILVEGLQDIDPEREKAAMSGTLDDNTPPEAFDVDQDTQSVDASVKQAISEREAQMIGKINNWIANMEQFRDFLNGTDNDSIQKNLATAESETILDKMRNAEQRKIARVATELAALIESFKGYIAQSGNSNLKYV